MSSQSLESKIKLWSKGPDIAEEARIRSTINTFENIVQERFDHSGETIRIKEHGSHYNRVNVRKDSDIDVGVICTSTFFYDLPKGMTEADFDLNSDDSDYEYAEFKRTVQQSLEARFGASAVKAGNKSFKLRSYEINADIVPFFEYKLYSKNGEYREGVALIPNNDQDRLIINWPEQHHDNGEDKHTRTKRRYKKLVRILKKLQHHMENEGISEAVRIPGFLCECLVWNVPDSAFGSDSLTVDLLEVLDYLNTTLDPSSSKKFWEVSKMKRLFGEHNKQKQQAYAFVRAARRRICQ